MFQKYGHVVEDYLLATGVQEEVVGEGCVR